MKSIKSILPLNLIKNNQNKGTEEELKNFFNEVYKIHSSIEFDQKYSKSKIEFLEVLVYKDERQRLQTTLFKKKADTQSYLCA